MAFISGEKRLDSPCSDRPWEVRERRKRREPERHERVSPSGIGINPPNAKATNAKTHGHNESKENQSDSKIVIVQNKVQGTSTIYSTKYKTLEMAALKLVNNINKHVYELLRWWRWRGTMPLTEKEVCEPTEQQTNSSGTPDLFKGGSHLGIVPADLDFLSVAISLVLWISLIRTITMNLSPTLKLNDQELF